MGQKPVLGKGLASLLPAAAVPIAGAIPSAPVSGEGATAAGTPTTVMQQELSNRDRHPGISLANVFDIITNPYQPRREFDDKAIEELAQSIQSNGIIQPLIVRKNSQGKYELIAGERRLRAAKRVGLKQVPIVIRKSTDRESLELALIENIQRQDLNCIDEALAYFQLVQDFSLTQEEIAQRVGKDRATVANYLRLLRLPEAIIDDLRKQILSFGHGKALLGLEDTELRLRARKQIIEKRLSVRDTEALVDNLKKELSTVPTPGPNGQSSTENTPLSARFSSISNELTRRWSLKVEVKGSERRGKIVFHYATRQELDRLLEAMQNKEKWAAQST